MMLSKNKIKGISLIELMLCLGFLSISMMGIFVMVTKMTDTKNAERLVQFQDNTLVPLIALSKNEKYIKVEHVQSGILPSVFLETVFSLNDYGIELKKEIKTGARNSSYLIYNIKYVIPTSMKKELENNKSLKQELIQNILKNTDVFSKNKIQEVDLNLFENIQEEYAKIVERKSFNLGSNISPSIDNIKYSLY